MTLLFQFIEGQGATLLAKGQVNIEKDKTNDIDREYIRSASATTLLKLIEKPLFEKSVSFSVVFCFLLFKSPAVCSLY